MMRLFHKLASATHARLFSQYKLYCGLMLMAVALSLAMAVFSTTAKQVHHDEYDHINAARFYFDHWLPPKIADPRALDSYSIYGMSYLNEWDIVYPLAAKFAMLLHPVVNNDVIALRLFNVGLFLVLGCIALFRRNVILAFAILLTSPQIWYEFSYFNGDAFPMFLSVLTAAALTSPSSLFNDHTRSTLIRYLPLGICIGLLVLSKKTFWAFGLFACVYIAWLEFAQYGRSSLPVFFKNMALLVAIICITAVPRIAYDLHINGTPSQKASRITETAEALAAPLFKPSTNSKASLNLRGKGVHLVWLIKPWTMESAASSFGAYNYNSIESPIFYYLAIIAIYALFLGYLIVVIIRYGDRNDKVVLVVAFLFCGFIVCLSIYHSWVNDFQPQGRYLFGIFSILAVILVRSRNLLNVRTVNLFLLSCFSLSVYSFAAIGLGNLSHFRDVTEISADFRKPQ